ncbi:MAG: AMP-binding protein [Acidimicrobiales bacterium]
MATTEASTSPDALNFATIWEGSPMRFPKPLAASHGPAGRDKDLRGPRRFWRAGSPRPASALTTKSCLYLRQRLRVRGGSSSRRSSSGRCRNVNYRYLADELAYLLDNADAKVLFFDETLRDRVAEVRDRCPMVTLLVQVGGGELLPGAVHHDDLIDAHEPAARIPRSGDDLWFLYTGGTTGNPKAVMWPHDQLIANMTPHYGVLGRPIPSTATEAIDAAVELHNRGRTTRLLAAAPLMHGTSGINALHTLTTGGMVGTLEGRHFDADELWTTAAAHRLTMLTIVGDAFARPMLESLERAEAAGRPHDLSHVYQIVSSGVMWSQESKQAFLRHKAMTLLDSLGSSESVGQAVQMTRRDEAAQSTGRFSLGPTTQVITDDGRLVEPGSGEIGRLANRGANPLGYYKDPEKTAETFPTIDGIRWSIPGDYATVEADGTITLLGRGSVCINSGGEKIYPEEVEEAVKSHPAVRDCNVVGLPDERWGQSVNAVVLLEPGDDVTDDDSSPTPYPHRRLQGPETDSPGR